MTLRKIIVTAYILLLLAALAMAFSIYTVRKSDSAINDVRLDRQNSLLLADELRESSKDLTAAVRQFAATGDERFASHYMDVVNIRAGSMPRPHDRTIAPDKRVALAELMRQAGFTPNELALLQKSSDLSNNLITLETEAMNAVRGLYPDTLGTFTIKGAPDTAKAMSLVFSPKYNEEVGKIMAPFRQFEEALNARLDTSVAEATNDYSRAMTLMLSVCVAIVVLFAGFLFMVSRFIVRPILDCDAFARGVAAGNLHNSLAYKSGNEIGALATSLRSIPDSLNNIIAEYKRMADALVYGNIEVQGDPARFSGDFTRLVSGTNAMMSRYQLILRSLTSPVIVLDKSLHITYMNEAGIAIAGSDYHGKTCREVMGLEDDGAPADAMRRAAESLRPATSETVAHPKGARLDISYTAIPFTNDEGKLAVVLQLITDLTAVKNAQRTILEVAGQAQDISERVAIASEQLSQRVEQVRSGAGIQRDRAASTATAMEEMNSTVLEVARNASQANQQSESTRSKASEGAKLVNQVIEAIVEVHTVASEVNDNMQQLGMQAENIGSVMNVISDIADQTNLLALNAAIEAARAGEAGRGFAVVADEVRKLAEKTMSATTEVGSSIKGIQNSTSVNMGKVAAAAESVGKATELASISGNALNDILGLITTNSSLIAAIATAAEEQSATSEKINQAIDHINHIANETASGMNDSATAVRELSGMAAELRGILDKLRS